MSRAPTLLLTVAELAKNQRPLSVMLIVCCLNAEVAEFGVIS